MYCYFRIFNKFAEHKNGYGNVQFFFLVALVLKIQNIVRLRSCTAEDKEKDSTKKPTGKLKGFFFFCR